jgi:hypothetical protein
MLFREEPVTPVYRRWMCAQVGCNGELGLFRRSNFGLVLEYPQKKAPNARLFAIRRPSGREELRAAVRCRILDEQFDVLAAWPPLNTTLIQNSTSESYLVRTKCDSYPCDRP